MAGPRIREFVDDATGEVRRVETTREAKRRHRMSGGAQWKPTSGQIKAAEIWNKQEEKIRKDKEREDRKRKNAARQAEKDARLKEIQQEMLQKGRITVEDTWGRISASQNRLHKFFVPPKANAPASNAHESSIDTKAENRVDLSVTYHSDDTEESDNEAQLQGTQSPKEATQESNTTAVRPQTTITQLHNPSPTEPGDCGFSSTSNSNSAPRKRKRGSQDTEIMDLQTLGVHPKIAAPNVGEHKSFAPCLPLWSQINRIQKNPSNEALMPPPPRPDFKLARLVQNSSNDNQKLFDAANNTHAATENALLARRNPLSEMTESQLNVRANEKADPEQALKERSCNLATDMWLPLSTQILHDTVAGLSTQDLQDDLDECDKENSSPLRPASPKAVSPCGKSQCKSPLKTVVCAKDFLDSPAVVSSKDRSASDGGNGTFDEFDDDEVNDDELLSLAATQQLRRSLLDSLSTTEDPTVPLQHLLNTDEGDDQYIEHPTIAPHQPALHSGDSFALSGVDDDDLLECMQEFDVIAEEDLADDDLLFFIERFEERSPCGSVPGKVNSCTKKRQLLPWDKNPICISQHSESTTTSSQATESFDD